MASRYYRIYKELPTSADSQEEFSNVYRYSHPGVSLSVPQDVAVATINALLALEKPVHATNVQFTRAESGQINTLNVYDSVDVNVAFSSQFGTGPSGISGTWQPENVVMVQRRVGKRRWLRKFIHSGCLSKAAQTGNWSFSWLTTGTGWAAILAYCSEIWALDVTVNGSSEVLTYEAGNGAAADGAFVADDRVRWHDLNY